MAIIANTNTNTNTIDILQPCKKYVIFGREHKLSLSFFTFIR